MKSGARGGARLTPRTYRLGVIGNDGLWPVGDEYKTGVSITETKLKKYSRDEDERAARDGRGVSVAAITSRTAKKAIKTAYDWTGIYGATTAAVAGTLGYLTFLYEGDELGWFRGPLATALIGSVYKLVTKIEKKYKEYEEGKQRVDEELRNIKGGYFSLLKNIMKSGLNIDEKIRLKNDLGFDEFTRRLAENKKRAKDRARQADELRYKLEHIKTCVDRQLEEIQNGERNNHAQYRDEVIGDAPADQAYSAPM